MFGHRSFLLILADDQTTKGEHEGGSKRSAKELPARRTIRILTVKSLKTRFREPLRRAIRAALGWFTIALGFCCAGVLPPSDEVL